jgi:hypothetical protein
MCSCPLLLPCLLLSEQGIATPLLTQERAVGAAATGLKLAKLRAAMHSM